MQHSFPSLFSTVCMHFVNAARHKCLLPWQSLTLCPQLFAACIPQQCSSFAFTIAQSFIFWNLFSFFQESVSLSPMFPVLWVKPHSWMDEPPPTATFSLLPPHSSPLLGHTMGSMPGSSTALFTSHRTNLVSYEPSTYFITEPLTT